MWPTSVTPLKGKAGMGAMLYEKHLIRLAVRMRGNSTDLGAAYTMVDVYFYTAPQSPAYQQLCRLLFMGPRVE